MVITPDRPNLPGQFLDFKIPSALILIHTPQLNFLFSDWLFSKYAECVENAHCTPHTAPRLHKVLSVYDRARERPID